MPTFRDLRKYLLPAAGTAALLAACDSEIDEGSHPPPVEPAAREIPVTTSSPEALADFEAGRRALDLGRRQQANDLFRAAVDEDPEFAMAYLGIADSSASAVEFKNHLDLARRHLAGKSDGEKLLVDLYDTYFANDAERRIELAERLAASYPNSPRAWLTVGSVKGDLNRNEDAREAFGKAVELAPDLLAGRYALWMSYLVAEPKSFSRALEEMRRCAEIEPGEAKCQECMGDVYRALSDFVAARQAYDRALEIDPGLAVVYIKKGHVESFAGNFEQAREAYDAGVAGAEGPDRPNYANFRAFVHLHGDDPRGALDELRGILDSLGGLGLGDGEISGVRNFTYQNLIMIALHHRLFEDAERFLEENAASRRAQADRLGDPDFARLQESEIAFWESQLAARRGDFAAAEERAESHKARLEQDGNPRRFEGYHGLRGMIALFRGDHDQAIEELQQANLSSIYSKYHLALAHQAAGHHDPARKLFREVGEWNFNSVGFALVRRDALRRAAE
jgi:tetratricopeptide (TPR) repeat protein